MFGAQENTLWVEKFRPGTLDGYVGNEHIIDKVKIYMMSYINILVVIKNIYFFMIFNSL